MVDGSSLLLDLDGVVVESVQRLEDGTRVVSVLTGVGGDLSGVRGALHQIERLGAHRAA